MKPATFKSTADDPACVLGLSNHTEAGNVSYISLSFEGMLTMKEYHCSAGYEVICGIFNVLREGIARVNMRGVAWCMRCGCDIEDGGGRGEWKEEEEEEEEEERASLMN